MLTLALLAGAAFTCTPVRVWDGDGPIWCAEGPKVRLAGIAAR
jgi:endonuclease YncB( thermonuclease family)